MFKPTNTKAGSIGAFFNKASSKPSLVTKKAAEKVEECKMEHSKEQSPSKENKPTLNISPEKEMLKRSPQAEVKNSSEVKSKKPKKVSYNFKECCSFLKKIKFHTTLTFIL